MERSDCTYGAILNKDVLLLLLLRDSATLFINMYACFLIKILHVGKSRAANMRLAMNTFLFLLPVPPSFARQPYRPRNIYLLSHIQGGRSIALCLFLFGTSALRSHSAPSSTVSLSCQVHAYILQLTPVDRQFA